MSKIVKKAEFQDVVVDLWNKVKENFVSTITYDVTEKKLKMTKSGTESEVAHLERFVDKSDINVINGRTTLMDGHILGEQKIHIDNTNGPINPASNNPWFTYKNAVIPADTVVSQIVLGVENDLPIGSTVSQVQMGFLEDNDRPTVIEVVTKESKAVVCENTYTTEITGTNRIIVIDVNRSHNQNTRFYVGADKMLWGERGGIGGMADGGHSVLSQGDRLSYGYGDFGGKILVFTENTPMRSLVKDVTLNANGSSLDIKKVDGTVSNVQLPAGGGGAGGPITINGTTGTNFTLTGENIKIDGTSQTSVKAELDSKVKSVNGVAPTTGTGNVTVDSSRINIDGNTGPTVKSKITDHDNEINTIKTTMVRSVNGVRVTQGTQNIQLSTTDIQATVGGVNRNLQGHLDNHNTRITTLESKHPTVRVGDIITSYKYDTEVYSVGGVTYVYCGGRTLPRNDYPELATILNQDGRTTITVPLVTPTNDTSIPGITLRKHTYIVAKIG